MVISQQHNFYENYTLWTCNLAIISYVDIYLHCYSFLIIKPWRLLNIKEKKAENWGGERPNFRENKKLLLK